MSDVEEVWCHLVSLWHRGCMDGTLLGRVVTLLSRSGPLWTPSLPVSHLREHAFKANVPAVFPPGQPGTRPAPHRVNQGKSMFDLNPIA
jgi:hypothetical protein